jgi:hypothetical protein
MSLRNEPRPDAQQLVRYILGLLPEKDAERIDEASIVYDEVAAQLRIVENDLIDDYACGNLTGETLEWFESYYLASARRRENVRFATSFLAAVDRAVERSEPSVTAPAPAVERADDSLTSARSHERMTPRSRLAWKLAAAAALCIVCGSLFETLRMGGRLNVARSETAALDLRARELEQQLSAQRAANAAMSQALQRARESAASAALPSAKDPSDRRGAPPPVRTIALVLLPQTRSIAPTPTLVIPRNLDSVAFELRIESNDYPRYQVGLRDPATNETVWRSGRIAAKVTGDQASVSVVVPTSVLKMQHYSLDVESAADSADVVGSYAFQVLPR